MNIGQNIANFRKEKHITQEQLGEAVGVTNRTVSKWESGVSSPGIDLIPTIASALGITLDQLFGVETPKESADISQVVKETISSSIKEYLEENLPDILEDKLSELMPQYMPSQSSEDGYFLSVLSRDKSTVCRFFGQGQITGPVICNKQPSSYCITVPAQGGNVLFSGYETKEEATKDLERIFNAYSAHLAKIEL